jgi:hypothetical protein
VPGLFQAFWLQRLLGLLAAIMAEANWDFDAIEVMYAHTS